MIWFTADLHFGHANIDVGVDAWNFCPVSIIEIERLAETKNNIPLKRLAVRVRKY